MAESVFLAMSSGTMTSQAVRLSREEERGIARFLTGKVF